MYVFFFLVFKEREKNASLFLCLEQREKKIFSFYLIVTVFGSGRVAHLGTNSNILLNVFLVMSHFCLILKYLKYLGLLYLIKYLLIYDLYSINFFLKILNIYQQNY